MPDLTPVEHDPFSTMPVQHDPFNPAFTPIDHDPWAGANSVASGLLDRIGNMRIVQAGKALIPPVWMAENLPGMARSALSGATLPGDVYAGRIDPTSPEGVARTQDLAGLAFTSGMPAAQRGAVGMAGGRLEDVIRQNAIPAWHDEAVVHVNVPAVEQIWSRDKNFHIPSSDPGQSFKLDRAKKFIQSLGEAGRPFEAPSLGIPKIGGLGFTDGRHRFAAMRDLGFQTAPVSMDAQSIVNARQRGLLVEDAGQ